LSNLLSTTVAYLTLILKIWLTQFQTCWAPVHAKHSVIALILLLERVLAATLFLFICFPASIFSQKKCDTDMIFM